MISVLAARQKPGPTAEFHIPVELDLHDPGCDTIQGEIRRVNTGFYQLWTPIPLQERSKLDILFDTERIEVEVVYCNPLETPGYLIGVRLTYGLEGVIRTEPRIVLALPAKVMTPEMRAPVNAQVSDMSRSGLGLEVPTNIPVGVGISVEIENGIAFGEVRHCTQKTAERWQAGLWLEEFLARRNKAQEARRRDAEAQEARFLGNIKRLFRPE